MLKRRERGKERRGERQRDTGDRMPNIINNKYENCRAKRTDAGLRLKTKPLRD